jgi:hypothetical protein
VQVFPRRELRVRRRNPPDDVKFERQINAPVTYLYPASATQYPANITSAVPRPGSGFREHPVIKWCFLQAS